jgi:hypothetical protein
LQAREFSTNRMIRAAAHAGGRSPINIGQERNDHGAENRYRGQRQLKSARPQGLN